MAEVLSGKKILVVDDEMDLREILRDEFEFAGATCVEAENGIEALSLAKAQSFDAIVSDIRMPGGDGLQLAKNIKSNSGSPVFFLITGFADTTPAEAYSLGVEGFIYKPFILSVVVENLVRVLQPPQLRWDQKMDPLPEKKIVLTESFEKMIENQSLVLGRGGLFLRGYHADLRNHDLVQVQFLGDAEGPEKMVGLVRWLHHDNDKSPASGLGLEFMFIPSARKNFILQTLQKIQPQCYIPRQ